MWEVVVAESLRVGDRVKRSSAASVLCVVRVSYSVDGSLVKVQYSDDSRDWWPVGQRVWREITV